MKTPLNFLTVIPFLIISVSFASCTKKNDPTSYGPLSATGTLIRAENSLVRRGSHILVVKGEKKYFVESRTQNMSALEGQTVYVQGTLEANTTPDLPVIMAESVKRSFGDEDLHRFEIPALNLRIGVPQTWAGTVQKTTATFLLPGETTPLLTIRRLSGSTLPPGGSPIFIKNRRGTRLAGQGNASVVYVLEKDSILEFHFDPVLQQQLITEEDGAIVASQFERALSTITFLTDKDVVTPVSGSGAGMACGGGGGVLCAAGYFCNITDLANQAGRCKKR